jgi:hypothetical protein
MNSANENEFFYVLNLINKNVVGGIAFEMLNDIVVDVFPTFFCQESEVWPINIDGNDRNGFSESFASSEVTLNS